MAREPLNKPVQETGSNNQTVKDHPQGGSGVSTAEKSTTIESLEVASDKGETPPVEENDGLPKEWAASSGVKDGHLHTIKVSVETQTDLGYSEQSSEVKPEPEVEKESDIKEMSTQTLLEEKDQLSPERDVKGKKKKQRPKKKRPSKEKKEAQPNLSSDDTQSWSISFQLPLKSGNIFQLVSCLVLLLFFCFIGVTQCFPVDNVKEGCHVYSVVAHSSITNTILAITKGRTDLCEISVNMSQRRVSCAGDWVFLINETSLLLFTDHKEKSDSYFLEAGEMQTFPFKYEGVFRDLESALKQFNPEEALTTPSVPTENPPAPLTAEKMPGWEIALIVLGILVLTAAIIVVGLCVFRGRLCKGNCQNGPPPADPDELETMGNSRVGNGPEHPATA
ncbi:uncharacterized protein [Aquarana catesbeiana]|uniref:uncharacterized protein n=1 Tax=Aquarana catesbeiana TaxID=8400 RepID=UPI003CC925EA